MKLSAKIVSPLLHWYDSHARTLPWRSNPEPYAVWISEIMLQQTRVEAVKPYFERWMSRLPDFPTLARASEEEVLKLWEGLGYYSRVRNIHKTARIVMEKYGGRLPSSFEELRSLPGIGEYTAGSVGSIAFQLPVPCVDGNVLRIVTRLTAEKSDIGSAATKKKLTGWVREILPKDRPGDFNQAMMELGATICLPNGIPKCDICPAACFCEARIQNRISEFPVKSAKQPRKIEEKTVVLLICKTKAHTGSPAGMNWETAIRKRPENGLLPGLWEFPTLEGQLSEEEIRRTLSTSGLCISSIVKLAKSKHIFSHLEWHMSGYLAMTERSSMTDAAAEDTAQYGAPGDIQWVGVEALSEKLALPAAFKTFYRSITTFITKESQNESKKTEI